MDFNIPADVTAYLAELDAFIEKEIKPLERENDNIRFFDHRREWARTDFERDGLPRHEWEALLGEMRRRADKAGHYRYALPKEYGGKDGTNLAMAIIREYLAAKGLGLHNDLQNESSIVGNLPTVLMFRDFGNDQQKKEFIPKLLDGSMRDRVRTHRAQSRFRCDLDGDARRSRRRSLANHRRQDVEHRPARRHARFRVRAHQRQGRQPARHHLLHRSDQERGLQDRRVHVDLQHADRSSAHLADRCRGARRRDSWRSGKRARGRAAIRPRESHSPGRELAGRGAILHQRKREVRQEAQAVRQTARRATRRFNGRWSSCTPKPR